MDQLLAISTLCFLCIIPLSHQQSLDEQIAANTVVVQFDMNNGELLELEDWDENDATSKFRDITADVAHSYCSMNLEDCSLSSIGSGFAPGDVMLTEDPLFYNGDIRFGVYISLENKNVNDPDMLVIQKSTLKEILMNATDEYEDGLVNPDTSYSITLMFVDGERIAPPIDYTVNIIMILVSLLILLSACFLACVLKCKEDMEQKNKLQGVATTQDTHPPGSNDAAENLTLTAIKPAADDDSKEPSEGSVYSWKNKVSPFTKSSVKTQETQTSGRVVFIPEGEAAASTLSPVQTPELGPQQHCDTIIHQGEGGSSLPELSDGQKSGANVNVGENVLKINVESSNPPANTDAGKGRSSRHNILPPLGETVVHDTSGELAGPTHGGTDGSESDGMNEKKYRKKRRKNKKKKNLASDDENNDLLNESPNRKALSPLGEEVAAFKDS